MPVEISRDSTWRAASAVLLYLRGRPAPEGLEVVEVLRAVVVRVPQFETRELIAGVRCPEDCRPHVVARVDAHLHAFRLKITHQVVEKTAIRVRVLPAATRTWIGLHIYPVHPRHVPQITHYLIHLVLGRDPSDTRKVICIVKYTCCSCIFKCRQRVRVDRTIRMVAANDREGITSLRHALKLRDTHRNRDIHSVGGLRIIKSSSFFYILKQIKSFSHLFYIGK